MRKSERCLPSIRHACCVGKHLACTVFTKLVAGPRPPPAPPAPRAAAEFCNILVNKQATNLVKYNSWATETNTCTHQLVWVDFSRTVRINKLEEVVLFCAERITYQELPQNNAKCSNKKAGKNGAASRPILLMRPFCYFLRYFGV